MFLKIIPPSVFFTNRTLVVTMFGQHVGLPLTLRFYFSFFPYHKKRMRKIFFLILCLPLADSIMSPFNHVVLLIKCSMMVIYCISKEIKLLLMLNYDIWFYIFLKSDVATFLSQRYTNVSWTPWHVVSAVVTLYRILQHSSHTLHKCNNQPVIHLKWWGKFCLLSSGETVFALALRPCVYSFFF